MLFHPTREAIETTINERADKHFDVHVVANECAASVLMMSEELEFIHFANSYTQHLLKFSDSAFSQLLSKYQIPVPFFKRCDKHNRKGLFNQFLQTSNKELLFRCRKSLDTSRYVRACLSNGYRVIDDKEVFPAIFQTIESDKDCSIKLFQQDEQVTQMMVHFRDTQLIHNGQTYIGGLLVTNSETGHSSVWVEPVVSTLDCTFMDRVALRQQGADIRMVHRGGMDKARLTSMITKSKDIAQIGIVQAMTAYTSPIETQDAVNYAKNIDCLPNRFVDILKEEWSEQEDLVKANVAHDIICAAAKLPLFQRVKIEQAACRIVNLYSGFKARMQAIIEEIEE